MHLVSFEIIYLFIVSFFSMRCNIYISHLCYNASVRLSVRLSVTKVHWRIIIIIIIIIQHLYKL